LSDSLASFIRAAPNITNFSLKCLSFGDTVLRALSYQAENLHVIHLKDCGGYTDTALCSLACECTNLRSVHLDSWEGDRQFSAIVVQTFAVHCRHLEGVQLHFVCTQDTLNQLLIHGGARLRYLSLQTAQFRKDAGLLSLAQRCKHLQELVLIRCSGFTADGVAKLVSSLKDLTELIIGNCDVVTDTVLIAIATHLPHLQVLQLYQCESYTTEGAMALVRSLKHIHHFSESSPHMLTGDRTVFTNDLMTQWKENVPGLTAQSARFWTHSTSYFGLYSY
jgi:F-box/leucine-rich repeat protein 2/20